MANRSGIPLDLIWVHVNLAHPRVDTLLTRAGERIAERIPGATLSVNRNVAGTEALVMITAVGTVFSGNLPANVRSAIIRIYTEADHDEAFAMVSTLSWTGPNEVMA